MKYSRQKHLVLAIILAVLLHLEVTGVRAAGLAHPNDTARYLAGLQPSATSPLAAASATPGWRRYATEMGAAWSAVERRLLTRLRAWAGSTLRARRATMFYMFSGPDFVHADAFFPDATTYVLSGLEPVGSLPGAAAIPGRVTDDDLASLRRSLINFLQFGYFITSQMDAQFRAGAFTGTLPILYVLLARSGKTIQQVEFVTLNGRGGVAPARRGRKPTGVRISFSGKDGRWRTLYYFSTNLANAGVSKSGFLKFCARLGEGVSLVKSASYLMHLAGFSRVRDFLLRKSAVIVQDDSGIPFKHFADTAWRLEPFGQYAGPIKEFERHYQEDLAKLFQSGGAQPVNFGIGYRWHPRRTNILVARRRRAPDPRAR